MIGGIEIKELVILGGCSLRQRTEQKGSVLVWSHFTGLLEAAIGLSKKQEEVHIVFYSPHKVLQLFDHIV